MTTHSTIGRSFVAHGIQGIDTAYTVEQRLAAAETRHALARSRADRTGLRHTLGARIISLGTLIAGTTATIGDRQATMPAPTPKSGFVPTR